MLEGTPEDDRNPLLRTSNSLTVDVRVIHVRQFQKWTNRYIGKIVILHNQYARPV